MGIKTEWISLTATERGARLSIRNTDGEIAGINLTQRQLANLSYMAAGHAYERFNERPYQDRDSDTVA